MPGLGYTSFLGIAKEAAWGTRITPATKFLAMTPRGDGLFGDSPLLKSAGINEVSTHRTRKVHPGARNAGGQIEFEVPWEGAELLFKHAFGKVVVSTETPPCTHTYTISPPDWLDLTGLSLEAKTDYLVSSTSGAAAWAAGLNSFWYEGSLITFVEFSLSKDGFLLCTMGVAAEDEIQATSSTGTPTASTLCNFYNDGTGSGVQWNGVAAVVTDFRVRLDLGLDVARRGIGNRLIKKPVPGKIAVTGSFKAEFEGVTHFDDFRAATARSLYLRLVGPTAASQDIKIEVPVAIIAPRAKAVVDNEGIIYADLPFEGFWDGTNREIKMTLINGINTVAAGY